MFSRPKHFCRDLVSARAEVSALLLRHQDSLSERLAIFIPRLLAGAALSNEALDRLARHGDFTGQRLRGTDCEPLRLDFHPDAGEPLLMELPEPGFAFADAIQKPLSTKSPVVSAPSV